MKNCSTLFLAFLMTYSSQAFSTGPQSQVPVSESAPVSVNATSTTAATYLNFEDGVLSTSAADKKWQIAVKRTAFQTNSGSSGSGSVGIFDTGATDFASVTDCAATSLTSDAVLPASGAPGSVASSGNAVLNAWYDYDMTTHTVSSKKLVYLVVEGDSCYKFQILDYTSGTFSVQAEALAAPVASEPQAPAEIFETEINASSATASVYFALEAGQLIPSTVDADWLIAVKRTSFQTNSGSSGTGTVGVANTSVQDFAAVTSCEGLSFIADAVLPASGAPGSVASSGNEILNAWYDYDMSTHTVTSKKDVYAISNGTQCVKFQILNYEAGRFSVVTSEVK